MGDEQPQGATGKLEQLARARFGETLTPCELKLLRAAPNAPPASNWAQCGLSFDDKDNDPSKADKEWGREREIRAEVIRWLCVDEKAKHEVDPKGIWVYGAKITGMLDLSFVIVPFPIVLRRCRLMEDADLKDAQLPLLSLEGSWVRAIGADRLDVKGSVFLRNGFRAEGEVRLPGGQIGSNLECSRSTFINPTGIALNADHIHVQGYVFLRNDFRAEGEVLLLAAQVGANVECDGSTFVNPTGKALNADRINVQGHVFLRNGFRAEGEVVLLGAQIGGNLECEGGTFINPSGIALHADGINVHGAVFLLDGFHAEGGVRLLGAQIGVNLECDRGAFINPSGVALGADHIKVQGFVFIRNGFRAEGEVRLLRARVGANVECEGGTFINPSGKALNADGINVEGSVFLHSDFRAEGEVWLGGAQIGGNLECTDSTFTKLTAGSATVKGNFWWWGLKGAEHTMLDLRNASVGSMGDDEKSWPAKGNLFLDGFAYGRISEGPTDAETRLKWLARQDPFTPQPYRQLAKVLREAGDDAGARAVVVAMEDQQRRGDITRPFLKWIIGYGQHPLRAGWWALGFGALGWILYRRSYLAGGMVPTEKDACAKFKPNGEIPKCYGGFFPSIYSLENSLPLVKLGQADKWQPDPDYNKSVGLLAPVNAGAPQERRNNWIKSAGRVRSFPKGLGWLEGLLITLGLVAPVDTTESPLPLSRFATSPRFLRWFLWFQILLGWLLATLFLAGVTGFVRKD